MKVKFTASYPHSGWHDPTRGHWKDGDIKDIPEHEAEYLTKTFPGLFSLVAEEKAAPAPESNRMERKPGKNR